VVQAVDVADPTTQATTSLIDRGSGDPASCCARTHGPSTSRAALPTTTWPRWVGGCLLHDATAPIRWPGNHRCPSRWPCSPNSAAAAAPPHGWLRLGCSPPGSPPNSATRPRGGVRHARRPSGAASSRRRARRSVVDGGYLFNGSWAFKHRMFARALGCLARKAEPRPTAASRSSRRSSRCPISTIEMNWDVDGLAGTGSNTTVARKVFVPEHRTSRSATCGTNTMLSAANADSTTVPGRSSAHRNGHHRSHPARPSARGAGAVHGNVCPVGPSPTRSTPTRPRLN